jgi:glycosyltransferase involved in cell wall biosynthesis
MSSCRISIVTPSYNQARFLTAALESVFAQGYPNLEYLVLDGGSQDRSAQIIERVATRLAFWRSSPDKGQAAAINEGFGRATGEILAWLNSDDLYMPATFEEVARTLEGLVHEPVVCYGGCELFWDGTGRRELRPAVPFDRTRLEIVDWLDQPSVFWTRAAWEKVGQLDETLHYAFDWDWFLRAAKVCRFIAIDALLSQYRIHSKHKSGLGGKARWNELLKVVRRHSPPEVIQHYKFLTEHPITLWWLNKRMRLEQGFRRMSSSLAPACADLLSPPFWFLPSDIRREMLWEISGIR